jgi:hypothetical protein
VTRPLAPTFPGKTTSFFNPNIQANKVNLALQSTLLLETFDVIFINGRTVKDPLLWLVSLSV